ncbi:hypothetical protein D3227_04475 [Mesorhizobium waimense]|uniref:Uncharacterized protein n=1 Tax=Mesorhizobium waimense TaxID=1300307 RepID=A0A3A5KYL9_9HYPH|nr:hypothetical protein D3227_04475 [Mesorhizobium waimense]
MHASLYDLQAEPQLNAAFMPQLVFAACSTVPRCAEIQVRPSRKWWVPRTGAERAPEAKEPGIAGRHHLNISTP